MAAATTAGAVRDRDEALEVFAAEGCSAPVPWSNGPGDTYGAHAHDRHKVLFCLSGSITFHVGGIDLHLRAGDRLDLERGTRHAATVGPQGCSCIEASR
jgi:mannose-6-phosphate isomerase-like protein (cupin superfamily)